MNNVMCKTMEDYIHIINELYPDLDLSIIPIPLKYDALESIPWKKGINKPTYHNGQLKLLLGEIEFLSSLKDIKYVVYAGGAEGYKNHLLWKLFPHLKFILIDPNAFQIITDISDHYGDTRDIVYLKFSKIHKKASHNTIHIYNCVDGEIYNVFPRQARKINNNTYNNINEMCEFITNSSYNLFIINDYMTNKLAKTFSEHFTESVFISDIRTAIISGAPSELDILWNFAQTANWIYFLRPAYCMIKFRLPWTDRDAYKETMNLVRTNKNKQIFVDMNSTKKLGIDLLANYKAGVFQFLCGKIHLQSYNKQGSTETRLWITKQAGTTFAEQYPIMEYDNMYNDKLTYYNIVCRPFIKVETNDIYNKYGICQCLDCYNMLRILNTYGVEQVEQILQQIINVLKINIHELRY